MDFAFTEEQEEIRALARRILTDRVTPDRLKEVEAGTEGFDRDLWRELGTANLLGIALPEDVGGSGYGFLELCIVLEEAARAAAPVPLYPALVLAGLPLATFGSPELQSRFLSPLASGESMLTAPLGDVEVAAQPDGDAWRLEGTADMVPAAQNAERILVSARIDGGSVGMFLVDPRAVRLERQELTDGQIGSRVEIDGSVSWDDVLSAPPEGDEILSWTRDRATAALSVMQVGFAERALRMTAEYTSGREQFERPLATFQAVQQRLADAYIDVEALKWTAWRAAWRLSQGLPAEEEIAVAKFWAADAGSRVTAAAQHLHGGIGVDVDYPLHRYTKHAKQVELLAGGATENLARLGELIAR
jgi:3-oxocholest-4-en-26-oyl-CoA dehydrogenase beta subunit